MSLAQQGFEGYELLATGESQRLERWCDRVILRPETAAAWPWPGGVPLPHWDGLYRGTKASGGSWEWKTPLPAPCTVRHGKLSFLIRPTASKHLGLFPEQAENWDWIRNTILTANHPTAPKILNLFGYTGGATLTAAAAGAAVTHVDSSRGMVAWCADNARLSGLGKTAIRYIVEDAMTFLRREARRGNRYDALVMDPPSYGRGRGGELWKLKEHLPSLLEDALGVLSKNPLFFLLNTYSEELDDHAGGLFSMRLKATGGSMERVDLGLTGLLDRRRLPLGKAHRWRAAA